MKYAIYSDIHSNLEALEALFSKCEELGVDQHVCLGDIVGYGPDPKACIKKVRDMGIICVKGNHDELVSECKLGRLNDVNQHAASSALWQNKILSKRDKNWLKKLPLLGYNDHFDYTHANYFTHVSWGYVTNHNAGKHCLSNLKTDVGFIGHTHYPCIITDDEIIFDTSLRLKSHNKYLINVGSVGQPRDRDPRICFVTYNTGNREICFHRATYDIEKTVNKIKNIPELTAFLAERLLKGV